MELFFTWFFLCFLMAFIVIVLAVIAIFRRSSEKREKELENRIERKIEERMKQSNNHVKGINKEECFNVGINFNLSNVYRGNQGHRDNANWGVVSVSSF